MKSVALQVSAVMAALLLAGHGHARAANIEPPAGALYELDGTAIPKSYQLYTTPLFTATSTSTNITFAFRDDPAFLFLDDVSVLDTTTMTQVPVVNGGFESGPVNSSTPTGWTYLNIYGATFGGFVQAGSGRNGGNAYYDGAVGSYDAITQAISTVVGRSYSISFYLRENSAQTTFRRVASSDANNDGINLAVYAGGIPTAVVPEPSTLAGAGLGLAVAVGAALKRRRKVAVA